MADASIFLDLDASATLDLGLDASATGSVSTEGDKSDSAEFAGCVDLKGGFSANAGAQGTFFDIFNENTQIPIVSKEFELFRVSFRLSYIARCSVTNRRSPRNVSPTRLQALCLPRKKLPLPHPHSVRNLLQLLSLLHWRSCQAH